MIQLVGVSVSPSQDGWLGSSARPEAETLDGEWDKRTGKSGRMHSTGVIGVSRMDKTVLLNDVVSAS